MTLEESRIAPSEIDVGLSVSEGVGKMDLGTSNNEKPQVLYLKCIKSSSTMDSTGNVSMAHAICNMP